MSTVAFATGGTHSHPVCGSACGPDCVSAHSDVEFQPITHWSYFGSTGNYYLEQDVYGVSNIVVPAGEVLNICLNGHKLGIDPFSDDAVTVKGTLNICDCGGSNAEHRYYETVSGTVEFLNKSEDNPNAKVFKGGIITDAFIDSYSNVAFWVAENGDFNFYGGTFFGNKTIKPLVDVGENATVSLNGGNFSNNTVTNDSAEGMIKAVNGTINLNSGSITNNNLGKFGYGIICLGDVTKGATLNINDCYIAGNYESSENQKSIVIVNDYSIVNMNGGLITNNRISFIFEFFERESVFNMYGGEIVNNDFGSSYDYLQALNPDWFTDERREKEFFSVMVFFLDESVFNMTGGSISNNKGAAVAICGNSKTSQITGGNITGNQAGVLFNYSTTLSLSGAPKMFGNKYNDVVPYFISDYPGEIIIGEAGLSNGALIGITPEFNGEIFTVGIPAQESDLQYFVVDTSGTDLGYRLEYDAVNGKIVPVGDNWNDLTDVTYTASLDLARSIDVNFKATNWEPFTSEQYAKLKVYVDGNPITTTLSGNVIKATLVSKEAKEIADAFAITVVYDGFTVKATSYSVLKYCNSVIDTYGTCDATPDDPGYSFTLSAEIANMLNAGTITNYEADLMYQYYKRSVDLCYATIQYGKYAADYFNYSANLNLSSADETAMDSALIGYGTPSNAIGETTVVANGYNVQTGLSLGSTTTMKFIITTANAIDENNIVIKNNLGEVVDPALIDLTQSGNEYTLTVNNITANTLSRRYTITINGVSESDFKVVFGPYDYLNKLFNEPAFNESADVSLMSLANAMYVYGEIASTYNVLSNDYNDLIQRLYAA